jgi:hypothetical protein
MIYANKLELELELACSYSSLFSYTPATVGQVEHEAHLYK